MSKVDFMAGVSRKMPMPDIRHMRILTWLNTPSPYAMKIGLADGPVPAETGMTHLQVLGLLIAKNGFKPTVERAGAFSGPFGLTPQDACLLMQLGPYLQGMCDGCAVESEEISNLYLKPELERIAAKWESEGKLTPEPVAEPTPVAEAA